jgi:predicted RNA-binding protein with PUA-like domain
MAWWLIKTEPADCSYDDLVDDGETTWEGVKNPVAAKHLKSMAAGDLAIVYHTGGVKAAVGIARVTAAKDGVVKIAPAQQLAEKVPLAKLKADKDFKESPLVKIGRLSVMPLTAAQWKKVATLSKTKI